MLARSIRKNAEVAVGGGGRGRGLMARLNVVLLKGLGWVGGGGGGGGGGFLGGGVLVGGGGRGLGQAGELS